MNKSKIIPAIFLALLIFTAAMYIIDPDEASSEDEKRVLASFPKFSFSSLADGSYTEAVNQYMTDQFPLRKKVISAGDRIKGLLSLNGSDVQLVMSSGSDDMGAGEILGGGDILAETPEPEKPEKKKPEAAKINVADEADYNSKGIIISGDRAMELFGCYYGMLTNYAALVNSIKAALPDINVYSMVIPTSVEFYSPVKYHEGMRSQKYAIDTVYSLLSPDIIPVDAYTYLAADADKYIYFRTDHHWTARGAYRGYYAFCEAAGLEPVAEKSFPVTRVEGDFLGTLYSFTKSSALKDNPDYVEVLTPPEVESCVAYTSADMSVSYDADVIIDVTSNSNKYLTFLGGDNPLLHIVTYNKNGKKLLILKDSFGNAFTPFMINHYEEIFALDPRSTRPSISEFCSAHGITDVIVENYNFVLSNSEFLNGLEAMAR